MNRSRCWVGLMMCQVWVDLMKLCPLAVSLLTSHEGLLRLCCHHPDYQTQSLVSFPPRVPLEMTLVVSRVGGMVG